MSEEVRDIYERVNYYNVQAETVIEQARQYSETRIPAALGTANYTVSEARAQHAKKVSAANTDLAEFWGVWEELRLVRERIYAANAAEHGHGTDQCAECERIYDAAKEPVYLRLYNSKYTTAIEKIGQIIMTDGDSKVFLNP
jgi:regulator of protease activity HflC (stomatin/prohibitin superfamily)